MLATDTRRGKPIWAQDPDTKRWVLSTPGEVMILDQPLAGRRRRRNSRGAHSGLRYSGAASPKAPVRMNPTL